ncbi:MAG TPA: hypothetical protein DCZ69_17175 [Syntrophobacteraceae bacterium]|nr:hypothetical protein [Syntrophobacteraceae bacterium]
MMVVVQAPNVFQKRKRTAFILVSLVLGLDLSGCAARITAPPQPVIGGRPPADTSVVGSWWACRFRVSWPPEREPEWAVDLLLAHAVIQPVIREWQEHIGYWRFHRRAARDQAGHQFSFLFHADPATAAGVFRDIEASALLNEALATGMVERMVIDDPASPTKPNLADTSDSHWSPLLQRTWPAYIMGVSALWLGLINEAMTELPGDSRDIRDVLECYRQANARVYTIWYKEGQHALLHHLNAIFGYKPMLIRKEMSF